MNEDFGFELPDDAADLTDREYVNLVNRVRGNFLSYVSVLDSTLSRIISDFFLRDRDDLYLWVKTVFDEDRTASFGAKIIWLSRILKTHAGYRTEIAEDERKRIQSRLNQIRIVRNDFAHNFAQNKRIQPEDVRRRVVRLYDFEEGKAITRYFSMREIMGMINDPWVLDTLERVEQATQRIRDGTAARGGRQ